MSKVGFILFSFFSSFWIAAAEPNDLLNLCLPFAVMTLDDIVWGINNCRVFLLWLLSGTSGMYP